jgi:2,4-dienoyl-CoA reductase-like NADH-dependent reductase (Old Yellow Enzyme family)
MHRPSREELFASTRLGSLTLRNRFVRSAAFEGMCEGGLPSARLVDYHGSVARGGVGMTTVAYASVSRDGLTYGHQLRMDAGGMRRALVRLTDAVHGEGAAACIQIGHAGYFADPAVTGTRPVGASRVPNVYGLSLPRPMREEDIGRVVSDFGRAAVTVRESGFDAVELQLCHGYLLSQFLSPYTNRRGDRYGGSLENRMRFPRAVVRRVREVLGPGFPVVAKVNLTDGFDGGLELGEAVEVARMLEREGVDALVLSGGFVSKVPMYVMRGDVPFAQMYENESSATKKVGLLLLGKVMVKAFEFREAYFLEDARAVRRAVDVPLMLVGGMRSVGTIREVVGEGFELVAMARPLIVEPDLVERMRRGETDGSVCEPCNRCIAAMDGGDMRCTERERLLGARGVSRPPCGR